MNKSDCILVTGGSGLVGSGVVRALKSKGFTNIISLSSKDCDLTDSSQVNQLFSINKINYVFHCAGKVGGIIANSTAMTDFMLINLKMAINVVEACHNYKVTKLAFFGSNCIYPRDTEQPIKEGCLLTGPLEKTNEGYALSKICGIKLCEYFNRDFGDRMISLMPENMYGPGDNFHKTKSHVFAAFIRRFHEAKITNAKEVIIGGTGSPTRSFMHVDDLADAAIFLMENYESTIPINVSTGTPTTIKELALMMKDIIGFNGDLKFDSSIPDGTPYKLEDISTITSLGWKSKIDLRTGIKNTYDWYVKALDKGLIRQ